MKGIVTRSSNQSSENMVADDSLPDFTGKVLNQAFKVQITSGQHRFLALKAFTKDVNKHWWPVELYTQGLFISLNFTNYILLINIFNRYFPVL